MIIIFTGFFQAYCQTDSTANLSEELSGVFVIQKGKEIVLPLVEKKFVASKFKPLESDPINIPIGVQEPVFDWPKNTDPFLYGPISIPLTSTHFSNYMGLAYGNYGSPQIQLQLNEQVADWEIQNSTFIENFRRGPVEGRNSSNGRTAIALSGIYKQQQNTLIPFVTFNRSTYRFYGNTFDTDFNIDETLPRVGWSHLKLGGSWDAQIGKAKYFLKPSLGSTYQNVEDSGNLNRENEIALQGHLNLDWTEEWNFGLDLETFGSKYHGNLQYSRSLLQAIPWIKYEKDQYSIKLGIVASRSNTLQTERGIYPKIEGIVKLQDDWLVDGTIEGGYQLESLNSLLTRNEFLSDSLAIQNIENKIRMSLGVNGTPYEGWSFRGNLSYARINYLPLFVPSLRDSSRYQIIFYNGFTGLLRLSTTLAYTPSVSSSYQLVLELNNYRTSNSQIKPWHLPDVVIKAFATHQFTSELSMTGQLLLQGGIDAPLSDGSERTLPVFADVSLEVNYRIDERWGAFCQIENLFNQEYERYLGYPVRGATFKVGASYRF